MTQDPAAEPSTLSDHDLVAEYEATSGDPADPRAEALLREIEKRGLDL